MAKNKFFAFFNTEQDFVRFMYLYIEKHPDILKPHDEETRHFARTWMSDIITMSLGRMGFREKKFRTLDETVTAVVEEFHEIYKADEKDDEELVYSRSLFERELQQYTGKFYAPPEARYGP